MADTRRVRRLRRRRSWRGAPLASTISGPLRNRGSMSEVDTRLRAALAGRYDVERVLGHGGMATVYLARDVKHGREVAVKVLRPDLAVAVGADRFLREIAIAARLQHPHILALIDSGEADGFLYYV